MYKSDTDLSDAKFESELREWLAEFHGGVDSNVSSVERRISGYMRQEDSYRDIVSFILSHLPTKPKDVLDIGSSTGGLSVALGLSGMQVFGIEPSALGVKASETRAARRGLEQRVRFRVGFGETLPFPDESFDLVVSIAVLEHVKDVQSVLDETYRVLRPGGYAYFEIPNNFCPFEGHYKLPWLPMMPKFIARKWVSLFNKDPGFLDHLHYMSRGIASKAFRNSGLCVIDDLYGDYIHGRVFGADWCPDSGKYARYWFLRPIVSALYAHRPFSIFLNRAVNLIAQKPKVSD